VGSCASILLSGNICSHPVAVTAWLFKLMMIKLQLLLNTCNKAQHQPGLWMPMLQPPH
jgi:hypothetical protein